MEYEDAPNIEGIPCKIDIEWVDEQTKVKARGWLKKWCEQEELPYANVKQTLYRYRQNQKKRIKPKKQKQKEIPSYDPFIAWLRSNPDMPFADQMIRNCEETPRKHWASIVRTTINLMKRYMESS